MGNVVIEFDPGNGLPSAVVKALTEKVWNVHRRRKKIKLGDGRVTCSSPTRRAIHDLLETNGVRVTQVVLYEHKGGTKTIRFGPDGKRQVTGEQLADVPWRQLVRSGVPVATIAQTKITVFELPREVSAKERKARQAFFDRLNSLEDLGLRDGLCSSLATIVDELNPVLEDRGVQHRLGEWHLIHFPRKTDGVLTPDVLLKPLEGKAPGLYKTTVEYVQAYQQGAAACINLGRDPSDGDARRNFISPFMEEPQDRLDTALLEVMMDNCQLNALGSLAG